MVHEDEQSKEKERWPPLKKALSLINNELQTA